MPCHTRVRTILQLSIAQNDESHQISENMFWQQRQYLAVTIAVKNWRLQLHEESQTEIFMINVWSDICTEKFDTSIKF